MTKLNYQEEMQLISEIGLDDAYLFDINPKSLNQSISNHLDFDVENLYFEFDEKTSQFIGQVSVDHELAHDFKDTLNEKIYTGIIEGAADFDVTLSGVNVSGAIKQF